MAENAAPSISAIDIKRLWYADPSLITADLTAAALAELLKNEGVKEIKNIHQDTWTLEESEASQDFYKNQLTGNNYRASRKTPGDLTVSWTIGQYDYALKAAFLGGDVTEDGFGWKRPREAVEIYKTIIALSLDDQYCVLPYASIKANEANTDNAIGIAITGTAMEPQNKAVSPEYWFDGSKVVPAA